MNNKTSDKNVAEDRVIAHKFAVMQQQLEQKEKRIDLMANYIVDLIKYNNPEEKREVEEIKQYFERKCEE